MNRSNEVSELCCVKECQFVNRQHKPSLILGDTVLSTMNLILSNMGLNAPLQWGKNCLTQLQYGLGHRIINLCLILLPLDKRNE